MTTPPYLKKGDTVGILSTARKISREELQTAIEIIESWGLQVITGKNLFREQHQFAGSDAERLEDLQTFLNNPDVKAIICARGGYGTVRIIDDVDFQTFKDQPKWICGYSDVTVLHNTINNLGIESLHSSMPVNFHENTSESLESFRKALFGEKLEYEFNFHPFNKPGTARGEIIGGNLSMIYSQLGSPSKIDTTGKILFIEDLDEYLYHIDRMCYNLKRNGYFEGLAGMIVGSLSDMNDNTVPYGKTALEIVNEHLSEYDFPVCFDFPAGHINDNRTLIFGRNAQLQISNNCVLKFDE